MKCFVCHKPVADQGETLPQSIHLGCIQAWGDDLEQAERAMFAALIPRGGGTIQFRRWAPLTTATQSDAEALDS